MKSLSDIERIEVERRSIDLADFKKRSAVEGDYDRLIKNDCALYQDGKLILLYITPDESLEELRAVCNRVPYATTTRTNGMVSTSRVFGFEPRNAIRKDFCSTTALANDNPEEHGYLMESGKLMAKYYQAYNPDLYAEHDDLSEQNLDRQYRIEGMPYTSGIVNKNNPLKYHFDTGNYKNVWSGMITLKDGIEGGHLALPEFGLGVELKDNTFFMFDGQGILHGVTPIKRKRPDATRYTIVYYSLSRMWQCQTIDDELIRIRKLRTERERLDHKQEVIRRQKGG